jgi:hypothetical protein
MIEVGNAIMENGGTRELEKLLEEAHGGREKRIRRSIFGGTERREVQNWAEKSLVMLEIFRCV